MVKVFCILGDFNFDLLQPDKPPKDGRDLLDILDIFDFKCLINSPTRMTLSTRTRLDLILINAKHRVLTSGVVNPHISDHCLTYAILRTSSRHHVPRKSLSAVLKIMTALPF